MFGWRGQLLRVNLTNGDIKKETLDPMALSAALGGLGLGALLLSKEMSGNPLCFVTGPLIGTVAPNGGRFFITARNPEGRIIGASISGKWGAELKFAGYDAIVFEGEASEPVYLWLKDGKAELVSATHVWGKKVSETTYALLGETDPQAVVACIGPAGENRVASAIVVGDILSASGTGFGAMMGAKNLKAVVVRGTEGFRVADRMQFSKQATTLRSHMAKTPIAAKGARVNGCMLMADSLSFEPAMADATPARTRGCYSCATCFSSFSYDEGKEVLPLSAGDPPAELNVRSKEYRTFMDFGLDYASVGGLSTGNNSAALAQQLAQGGAAEMVAAETPAIQRGPCMFAGYAIVPRISSCESDFKIDTMAAVLDSVGLCPFLVAGIDMNAIAELMSTATGLAFSEEQIAQAGQRIAACLASASI